MSKVNVFDYSDFRKYLADWFEEQKVLNPAFSYKYFADKAGFKNKGFIYNIIKGVKNPSNASAFKLSAAIKHTRAEAEYFKNMVAFNLAVSLEERNHFYQQMESVRNSGSRASAAQKVRKDQYEFYSRWYHGAVRSVIDMYEFKDDYAWLAKAVFPAITVKQARDSVALLERIGLIKKDAHGIYVLADKTITTGKEVLDVAVPNLHIEMMGLAAEAVKRLPRAERNITGLLLGISPKTYGAICEETLAFQERLLALAEQDTTASAAYQFNFHFFPLSQPQLRGKQK